MTSDLPPTAIHLGWVSAVKCFLSCWWELISFAVNPRPIIRGRVIAGFVGQGLVKYGSEGGYLLSICRGHDLYISLCRLAQRQAVQIRPTAPDRHSPSAVERSL